MPEKLTSHRLRRLFGVHVDKEGSPIVALAGNPNVGKTTLFNALTGLRQHTGNWPGKTVTRAQGMTKHRDTWLTVVDLPGTYSLLANSEDERVARDFIVFGKPDVVVVVVDATAIERNLNLVIQVLEITDRAVVAVNLIDEAEKKKIHVDIEKLRRHLGVPVLPVVARDKEGLDPLGDAILGVLAGKISVSSRQIAYGPAVEEMIQELQPELERRIGNVVNSRWLALRLLEGDETALESLRTYLGPVLDEEESTVGSGQEALA